MAQAGRPNRVLIRYYYDRHRKHRTRSLFGWYGEVDFFPGNVLPDDRDELASVEIIKEIDLGFGRSVRTWKADWGSAIYDGTTLYVSAGNYVCALEIYSAIVNNPDTAEQALAKPSFPPSIATTNGDRS
ncbi:MAG TPA: hypothetical protein VJM32_05530 [Candidatus Saccharimonadales bacterium]|nr:hypothetical protein [Candidatus Saccharimonadales bacterium]